LINVDVGQSRTAWAVWEYDGRLLAGTGWVRSDLEVQQAVENGHAELFEEPPVGHHEHEKMHTQNLHQT